MPNLRNVRLSTEIGLLKLSMLCLLITKLGRLGLMELQVHIGKSLLLSSHRGLWPRYSLSRPSIGLLAISIKKLLINYYPRYALFIQISSKSYILDK